MLVKRFQDAKPYEAPNHRGVVCKMLVVIPYPPGHAFN